MFDKIQNNDLIITNNKDDILNYLSDTKKMLNLKIMTLKEFVDCYFGTYNYKALYYLIEKYSYKFDVAKMYLDNFLFNKKLKKELEENNLIDYVPLFKESIKRIVLINIEVDPYILKEIQKYEYLILNDNEDSSNNIIVKEFANINDEVNFIAVSIIEMLKEVDINKIFLLNVSSDYELIIKRIFKLYNIPINLNLKKNIYGTNAVKKFITNLEELNSIEDALENISKDEIYDAIVDVCNKYRFKELDRTIIYMIKEELKNTTIAYPKYKNAVNVCNLDEVNNDNYYFLLGFNEGLCPIIYKDEDYLSDKQKKEYGIFTSLEKNINSKKRVEKIIKTINNLVITYKLKNQNQEFYPSSLINSLSLKVEQVQRCNFSYSHLYNKLLLCEYLDDLIKFNTINPTLNLLYNNYSDIEYLNYDNKYKGINKDLLKEYLNNKMTLSYSSLDNFYHCQFRFFLTNILKLDKYEETFMTFIGNLYHYILSVAFNTDFDFDSEFNSYIENHEFSAKEKFFIKTLRENLKDVIELIKKQDEYSMLNETLYEKKVIVKKTDIMDIDFVGIIDKVKYKEIDNQKYVAVIDYKTGTPHIDIHNLNYGLSMQLPTYLYLLNNLFTEDINIAGFYLQKIVHEKLPFQNNKNYEEEVAKLYKLEGFSNEKEDILAKFDTNYANSNMIKSMKTSSKGFYPYAKVLSNNELKKLIKLVDEKINEAIKKISEAEFTINPKKINNKNIGCEFCKFKDICFMREDNALNLKQLNYKEFLGGDKNADVD